MRDRNASPGSGGQPSGRSERENADMWRLHARSFEEFLRDLYAIMVDPCAEGVMQLSTLMQSIKVAALRDREKWATPSTAGGQEAALAPDAADPVPPATTNAAPQVCCGEFVTCSKPCTPRGEWIAEQRAAAAPSGPTEMELDYANEVLVGGYDGVKNILASAVLRWKEQSK